MGCFSSEGHQTSLQASCMDGSLLFDLVFILSLKHCSAEEGESKPRDKTDYICSFLCQLALSKERGEQPSLTQERDFSTLLINFLQNFCPSSSV